MTPIGVPSSTSRSSAAMRSSFVEHLNCALVSRHRMQEQ
jgi:hypothetical protein